MQIKIKNRNYDIIFGLKGINYLDHVYERPFTTPEGAKSTFSDGVNGLTVDLLSNKVMGLYYAIKAGTITEANPPSDADIEQYLIDRSEKEDGLDKAYKDFLKQLKTQPLTRKTATPIVDKTEEVQKEIEEKAKSNKKK